MRDIVKIMENASDGSNEAVQYIDLVAKKFGRAKLAGGNCGTFSLALATRLREKGFVPTFGVLFRWNADDEYETRWN